MKTSENTTREIPEKLQLNIAVVGGGCKGKAFLEMLQTESFPYVDLNLVGVCDINPEAEGLQMAKKWESTQRPTFAIFLSLKTWTVLSS